MSEETSNDAKIEGVLKIKADTENRIKRQVIKLMQLEAHKKTLVTTLVDSRISTNYPVAIKSAYNSGIYEIEGVHPIYILNLGSAVGGTYDDQADAVRCPVDYKILRRFRRHLASKSSKEEIFYTSFVFHKNGHRYFVIKDDENNMCKGADAFAEFQSWFDTPIPFRDIEDWLGLYNPDIQSLIARLVPDIYHSTSQRPATLTQYFNN